MVTVGTGGGAIKIYTKTSITGEGPFEYFDVESSAFGKSSRRVKHRLCKISITPFGKYATGLWPFGGYALGQRVANTMGYPDVLIQPLDTTQKQWRFYGGMIGKPPPLILSSTKTIAGAMEIWCLGKQGVLPSVADSLLKREANTFADTSFSFADAVTQAYSGAWNGLTIDTKDGWTVDLKPTLAPFESDTYGIVDYTMDDLEATARCVPRTLSEDDLMASAPSPDVAIGGSVDTGHDLVITGTGVTVSLYNALLEHFKTAWDLKADRIESLEFVTRKKLTAGALGTIFGVA